MTHALNTEMLPRPTYGEIEGAIGSVEIILNEITEIVFDYSNSFHLTLPFGHDGNKLLGVLAKAHGYRQNEG